MRISLTAKKTNEWVFNKAGVKRELLETVKAKKLAYYGHTPREQGSCLEKWIKQETMPGARMTTQGLNGQHQDVDKTPRGRVSQNDRDKLRNYTSIVWPTLGSRTAKEHNILDDLTWAMHATPSVGQLLSYWARRGLLRKCTYKLFYFSTDLYRLGHAFHAILYLVWEESGQKWHFVPTWHPIYYRIEPRMFYSSPYAVCREISVEPFSGLRESAAPKSEGGYKLANFTRAWLSRLLCGFYHPVQNISGHNNTVFWKNFSFGRHVRFIVGAVRRKVTFCPQRDPYRFQKFDLHVFYSSSSAVRYVSFPYPWAFLLSVLSFIRYGFHETEEYSKIGLTYTLYDATNDRMYF